MLVVVHSTNHLRPTYEKSLPVFIGANGDITHYISATGVLEVTQEASSLQQEPAQELAHSPLDAFVAKHLGQQHQ